MKAEILATGDEIRSGALVDSNSAYIASTLEAAGVEVVRHSCVGDHPESIVTILQEIASRSDVAVVTGGLGPTGDDLTAAAAAKAAGVELVLDPLALDSVEAFFKVHQRPVSVSNKKQALLPAGADCLIKPGWHGTGLSAENKTMRVLLFTGGPFRDAANADKRGHRPADETSGEGGK